jgi:hypothetical protein
MDQRVGVHELHRHGCGKRQASITPLPPHRLVGQHRQHRTYALAPGEHRVPEDVTKTIRPGIFEECLQTGVDLVAKRLDAPRRARRSATRRLRLVGGDRSSSSGEPGTLEHHLAHRYGTMADEIRALIAFRPDLGEPLVAGQPYRRAEAVYAVRHEMASTLDDVLARRTRAHLFDRPASLAAAPAVAALLAGELGWSPDETARQIDDYRRLCAAEENAGAHHAHVANTTD